MDFTISDEDCPSPTHTVISLRLYGRRGNTLSTGTIRSRRFLDRFAALILVIPPNLTTGLKPGSPSNPPTPGVSSFPPQPFEVPNLTVSVLTHPDFSSDLARLRGLEGDMVLEGLILRHRG